MSNQENTLTFLSEIPASLTSYFSSLGECEASAVLIGTQIDLKALSSQPIPRWESLMVRLEEDGIALIYRYGAIMLFNASVSESAKLIAYCQPFTTNVFTKPETETLVVKIKVSEMEGIKEGKVYIQEVTKPHLEIIGNVLTKSVILDYYENRISYLFDKVDPIARNLTEKGNLGSGVKELLQHIGATLLMAHEMVGKIEVSEKPRLLWELVQFEPLYLQLFDDLEIKDRQEILNKKISLIEKTAETSLGVLEHRHSNRLEWYIIILIGIEIVLDLYDLFFAHSV